VWGRSCLLLVNSAEAEEAEEEPNWDRDDDKSSEWTNEEEQAIWSSHVQLTGVALSRANCSSIPHRVDTRLTDVARLLVKLLSTRHGVDNN
jgi:hypothetical protein